MRVKEIVKLMLFTGLGAWAHHAYLKRKRAQSELTIHVRPDVLFSAQSLKNWLDACQQKVVILARRGQNLDKHAITFSHAAYAVYDDEVKSWRIHHLLNPGAWKKSTIQVQSLVEFMNDDLYAYEVAAVIPPPELQQRIVRVLQSEAKRTYLHHPYYSAIAYPFSTIYQNSNGWLLETFAMAVSDDGIHTRQQAQQWLLAQQYQPTVINVSPIAIISAKLFKDNLSFDDQPEELLVSHQITVHTGDSTLAFIAQYGAVHRTCANGIPFSQIITITPGESAPGQCGENPFRLVG